MAYTFFKAQNKKVGKSLCEDDFLGKAAELLEQAKEVGCEIVLPVDTVVAKEFKANAEHKTVESDIEDDWKGWILVLKSRKLFAKKLTGVKDNRMERPDGRL